LEPNHLGSRQITAGLQSYQQFLDLIQRHLDTGETRDIMRKDGGASSIAFSKPACDRLSELCRVAADLEEPARPNP
jgi:hypothetical protein